MALLQTLTVGAVNLLFTIVAIYSVDRWGRKPLMLAGAAGMGICLFAMGTVSYFGRTELWVLLLILGYIGCFALSIGPVTWVILSEIFPTKIRGRALALSTFCLWTANFVVSQTFPMMNENSLVGRHLPPRVPVLGLRRALPGRDRLRLADGAGNQGPVARANRADVVPRKWP